MSKKSPPMCQRSCLHFGERVFWLATAQAGRFLAGAVLTRVFRPRPTTWRSAYAVQKGCYLEARCAPLFQFAFAVANFLFYHSIVGFECLHPLVPLALASIRRGVQKPPVQSHSVRSYGWHGKRWSPTPARFALEVLALKKKKKKSAVFLKCWHDTTAKWPHFRQVMSFQEDKVISRKPWRCGRSKFRQVYFHRNNRTRCDSRRMWGISGRWRSAIPQKNCGAENSEWPDRLLTSQAVQ